MTHINCPKCGSVMVLRENKKNGSRFYGCSAFGRSGCRGFLPFVAETKEVTKVALPTNVVGSIEQTAIWETVKSGTKNLIIEAVAGSGKTFTAVHSLQCLVGQKVIFTAFNKHIADELATRVPSGIIASTLHTFGFNQIKKAFGKIKLNKYKLDEVIEKLLPKSDDKEEESKNIFLRGSIKRLVQLVKYDLGNPKDEALLDRLTEYHGIELNDSRNEIYTLVNTAFSMSIRDTKQIDFDDMIYFVFAHSIPVEQFDVFIGDEIQDWNKMQQHLAMQAIVKGGRFIGVGDRYQSIYGFAGADINSIPNMLETLASNKRGVESLPLTETRRCPKSHVTLAQQFVPHLKAMENAIDGTIDNMTLDQALIAMQANDMGICRRNAPLISLAYKLLRNGKKVIVKGRDIGQNIISLVTKLRAQTIPELIEKSEVYRAKELEKLEAKGKKAENQIVLLNDKIDTLQAFTEDMDTIDQLIRKVKELFNDDDEARVNAITLSSVHKAKGLEADTVYIIDHDRLMIPMSQDWAILQEKNLAYVAYTRSKNKLVLVD